MASFASLQEEIVHSLTTRVLGTRALFCPDCYNGSKEPADVAWVVNRCAILMYMTSGRASLEKKVRHNLKQLRKWLKVWEAGESLSGSSGMTKHSFSFADIDHIIGLSVVGGEDTGCINHPEMVEQCHDRKLSVCATISDLVMREMALANFEPRDLLALLRSFEKAEPIIPEMLVAAAIHKATLMTRRAVGDELAQVHKEFDYYSDGIDSVRRIIAWMKSHENSGDELVSIASDLRASDVWWLGASYTALEAQIAAPGETGHLGLALVHETGPYDLGNFVFASLKYAAEHAAQTAPKRAGISIVSGLDFGKGSPARMMAVLPREGPSELQRELDQARASVLQCNGTRSLSRSDEPQTSNS